MNIDDDNALWSKTKDPRDNAYKSDFYDEWSKRKIWPSSFAESYNRDIDFDEAKDSIINPKHYKNVAAGKQYMELMVDMLDGKSGVEAHLFGQVYKYLMRCGNKDEEVQELEKALWYLNALIKYKKEGIVL